jgi:aspartyl-tRNA(Asn)/glutamyl-tRNA(Gln) amidotransferase subunit B
MDAGKSIHDLHPSKTYIDFNRAGVALMEIVSEPDMRSSQEAMAYVKKLRTILRYLETCDGNMEQGNLRVDANISLRRPGEPFGTRAEIKNVNSIRFLGQAIEFEIDRQLDIIESGGKVVQETRLFDPSKGETRSMRSKEDAHDYRYFPDPDLPALRLTDERIEHIKATLPELPDAKKDRFMRDFNLTEYDADILVSEKETADYYETAVSALKSSNKSAAAKMLANWLIGEVFAVVNKDNASLDKLKASDLACLVDLIQDNTISGKIAKDVFAKLWETGKNPKDLVSELGLQQITDPAQIQSIIDSVIAKNPGQVEQFKTGKQQLFGFFVGQVMAATKGKANPGLVNELLVKSLT